jgi:hypothetical protein
MAVEGEWPGADMQSVVNHQFLHPCPTVHHVADRRVMQCSPKPLG